MSLEKAVEENTKALMALTTAFMAASGALGAADVADTSPPMADQEHYTITAAMVSAYRDDHECSMADAKATLVNLRAQGLPAYEAKKPEAVTETKQLSEASAPITGKSSVELTYATDVKPLILEICAKGIKERGKVEALLQRFGVKAAPGLKPEQFSEFVGYAKRIRDEGFDPADSHE